MANKQDILNWFKHKPVKTVNGALLYAGTDQQGNIDQYFHGMMFDEQNLYNVFCVMLDQKQTIQKFTESNDKVALDIINSFQDDDGKYYIVREQITNAIPLDNLVVTKHSITTLDATVIWQKDNDDTN